MKTNKTAQSQIFTCGAASTFVDANGSATLFGKAAAKLKKIRAAR